jgi:hypothetical protein
MHAEILRAENRLVVPSQAAAAVKGSEILLRCDHPQQARLAWTLSCLAIRAMLSSTHGHPKRHIINGISGYR